MFDQYVKKAVDSVTDYLGIPSSDRAQGPLYKDRKDSRLFQYTIHSRRYGQFSNDLPPNLRFNINSKYSNLMPSSINTAITTLSRLSAIGSGIAGTGSTISTHTKFTQAQFWDGTDPINITLPIKLWARTDVNKEVLQPMLRLGMMALPYEGSKGSVFQSFLRAPGPNIYEIAADPTGNGIAKAISSVLTAAKNAAQKAMSAIGQEDAANAIFNANIPGISSSGGQTSGDEIIVQIGNIMKLEHCIITKVDWDVDLKRLLADSGKPMIVNGSVTIKSSTVLTASDYARFLHMGRVSVKDVVDTAKQLVGGSK